MKTFIERTGLVVYIVMIISVAVFNTMGYIVIDNSIINILKVLYFVILAYAVLSFYISKRKNTMSILLMCIPNLLLFTAILDEAIPYKVITMIIIFPLFLLKGIDKVRKIIGISIYSAFIAIGILGLSVDYFSGGFGEYTILSQQYSPNGMYRIVVSNSDQGALGGDTSVDLEGIYYGIIKKNIKTLYDGEWDVKPTVRWVDNNTVNINGRDMNIFTSKMWYDKK